MMCSAVFGQGEILRHRVEVGALRRGVVPPVTHLDGAALFEERQRHGDLREGQVLALGQRLERERRPWRCRRSSMLGTCGSIEGTPFSLPSIRTIRFPRIAPTMN